MTSTLSRSFPPRTGTYRYYQGGINSNVSDDTGSWSLATGDQVTTSYRSGKSAESEPDSGDYTSTSGSHVEFLRELSAESKGDLGRSSSDNGHEFSTTRNSIVWNNPATFVNAKSKYGNLRLVNAVASFMTSPTYPPMSYPSTAQKNVDGTKLIGMAAPTNPELRLAEFMGELREGLPQITGLRTLRGGIGPKTIGHEHLNYQFGIKPLKSDLENLARGIMRFHNHVDQMKRDSGRYVHRKRSFGATSYSVDRGIASGSGLRLPFFYGVNPADAFYEFWTPNTAVVDNYHSEVWFSGAFTYHLAQAHSFLGKLERYQQLAQASLGTSLEAGDAWELTPWSWLVDWFADVGSFLHNVDLFSGDNLVMKYGYVMHHTKCVRTYTSVGHRLLPGASGPTSFMAFLTSERKERTRASPYGFGVDLSSLNPHRLAILGALGLTKAPGVMKFW